MLLSSEGRVARRLCGREQPLNFINYQFFGQPVHARMISPVAGFVTEHRTGSAVEVNLYGILQLLSPAVKARKRMGCSPYANNRYPEDGGEMHISRVHADHHVHVADDRQFVPERITTGKVEYGKNFLFPLLQQ